MSDTAKKLADDLSEDTITLIRAILVRQNRSVIDEFHDQITRLSRRVKQLEKELSEAKQSSHITLPGRDDLIQVLLATRNQSEGITADAILGLLQ